MRTTISPLQLHDRYAFYWRQDGPVCELYAENLEALMAVRMSDVTSAGLPMAAMPALCEEAAGIQAHEAELQRATIRVGRTVMLVIGGVSGRVLERWTGRDPWVLIAARLRGVA
jgi:hypothetical protein